MTGSVKCRWERGTGDHWGSKQTREGQGGEAARAVRGQDETKSLEGATVVLWGTGRQPLGYVSCCGRDGRAAGASRLLRKPRGVM